MFHQENIKLLNDMIKNKAFPVTDVNPVDSVRLVLNIYTVMKYVNIYVYFPLVFAHHLFISLGLDNLHDFQPFTGKDPLGTNMKNNTHSPTQVWCWMQHQLYLFSLKFYAAILRQCFVCVDVNEHRQHAYLFELNPINVYSYRQEFGLTCTNHFAVQFQIYSPEPEGFQLT